MNENIDNVPSELSLAPDRTVRFICEDKEVGCLDFGQSPMTFVGDADESAKIFINAIIRIWPDMCKNAYLGSDDENN